MPTLGIGNSSRGFTLLEIMAVLFLIGLTAAIVFPNLMLRDEQLEVDYIGKLIRSDIALVKSEADASRFDPVFGVTADGYRVRLGSRELERAFPRYQFKFNISGVETTPGETSVAPVSTPDPDSPPEASEARTEWVLFGDDSDFTLDLSWDTQHFKGTLKVNPQGVVEWKNEKK